MANKRWSEAVEEYIRFRKVKKGADNATANSDHTRLRMMGRMLGGDRVLSRLEPQHITDLFYGPGGLRDWHKTYSSRGQYQGPGPEQVVPPVSESTHNLYRTRLNVFIKWCKDQGYIKRDVNLLRDIDTLKVQPRDRQRPSPTVLLDLLDATGNERDRCYMAFALNSAMRQNEIVKITIGQVRLDEGIVKGVLISKTGDLDDLPISSDLDVELRAWITQYSVDIGRPLEDADLLFPGRHGGSFAGTRYNPVTGEREPIRTAWSWMPRKQLTRNVTAAIVKDALKAVGLETRYEGTHTIRRSVARAYYDAALAELGPVGALRETMALLHHSNSMMTERYLGVSQERDARDRRLKGRPFLSAMVAQQTDNVIPLRKAE